ncbi:16S rRNA (uracil(1498)-N(3))-methyltransferase [Hydrogenimonas thermophila]|uniref:16S rRNA (uracil(1498)-N(3))-methyltransferase n=1 Tax=Hydrogenimonas thermophila TaxID=223786 RepID=UPI002936D736|nr:16S rRNA (uracil(1498)-N(3))-methyltransferase [Hydrogenimonas thermophila]WOE69723.1 16S rRNA (uracil(1498)-N(3))-methyltransferase [Hydrogenimonas thermophila]WOE72237.1 16S rRNA (uracil(1498)-N(3))-methyltransferase [Hydrogenimonas thermophila]
MQFLYHPNSGLSKIKIEGEFYKYIFKVRRHKEGERIALRNLQDQFIYFYKIERVTRREAELLFLEKEEKVVMPKHSMHIGWCIIDPKVVEKTLPMLNELGVEKITFIYCDRSQKNFKLDFDRLNRILINSSQQCGRSSLIKLEMIDSIDSFFQKYPESAIFDFGGKPISCKSKVKSILVGCEGGFSDQERVLFKDRLIFSLNTPLILRSESAVIVAAAFNL